MRRENFERLRCHVYMSPREGLENMLEKLGSYGAVRREFGEMIIRLSLSRFDTSRGVGQRHQMPTRPPRITRIHWGDRGRS